MNKVAAIAAVLAILVLGILVGVLGTHLFYAQKFRRPGLMPMMAGQMFAERLDHELSLSDEQRIAIAEILEQTRLEADAMRSEVRPRIAALLQQASERISEVLTPEQRRRFAQLREEHRGRAEHFLLGPPGPHGPPGRFRGPRRPPFPGPPPLREPAPELEEKPDADQNGRR